MKSPEGYRRIWCVVENEDDVSVYENFFDHEKLTILPSRDENDKYSCRNVEQIVSELHQEETDAKVFGIRDRDYTDFYVYSTPQNVFLTDERDLEMAMLKSRGVTDGLRNWNSEFPDKISRSCKALRHLGYLRIFNDVNQTSCVFKDRLTRISLIWDYGKHEIKKGYEDTLTAKFIEGCGREVLEEEIENFIQEKNLEAYEDHKVCRGHDVLKLLSVMMIKAEFSRTKDIFCKMKKSYGLSDFKAGNLYQSISEWLQSRGINALIA